MDPRPRPRSVAAAKAGPRLPLNPDGSLTLSGSKLFGMTAVGGTSNTGTLFSMNTDGTGFRPLHSFTGGVTDGYEPQGSLTLSGSTLYGMTGQGGSGNHGVLFSIRTDGTGFGLLESFGGPPADGGNPQINDLILSGDGSTLYGTTYQGGSANRGVVFSRTIAPVPEPGTWLTGIALCLPALLARRKG